MGLNLYAHNAKAYKSALAMMQQYGKAAIVHPTGTGKSYIAFKLIEDHPEAAILWLSPSEYIFKTQLDSLKMQDVNLSLANVTFYTYAKLMCCTEDQLAEIAAQHPAYIILDEFHRTGAEYWGKGVTDLLKLCPDAKLLGLTATNVRYLDNNHSGTWVCISSMCSLPAQNTMYLPSGFAIFLANTLSSPSACSSARRKASKYFWLMSWIPTECRLSTRC